MEKLEQKLSKISVLIIDDHKFLRDMLRDMLRGFGVSQLHVASHGREGIEAFRNQTPSLVFTDLNMEPMNGLDFTQWIRTNPNNPNPQVPIIMLTANNDATSITAARDAGVSELIIKPLVPSSVLQRLNAALFEPREFITGPTYTGPSRRRRSCANYKGIHRRAADPLRVSHLDLVTKKIVKDITVEAKALMKGIRTLDVTDRLLVRAMLNRAKTIKQLATQVRDEQLISTTSSLVGYVEAVGANGNMDVQVIKIHLDAVMSLVHLQDNDDAQRNAIVQHVQNLVQKKFGENL